MKLTDLTQLAAQLLKEYGADFESAQRAGGWTNHVYLAGDIVLRIAPDEASDRIRRETALVKCLPKLVGYPENIATGIADGHEWSVSRRVPGGNLGDAWENLSWTERTRAVRELWDIVRAVHAVDVGTIPVTLPQRTWYSDLSPEEASKSLDGLVARGCFARVQSDALAGILRDFFGAIKGAKACLCHGDITMENMMWFDGHVKCLMDFEHAAILPAEADIYSFLRFALEPGDTPDAEQRAFREEVASLARSAIGDADSARLLVGFAALISMRHMYIWMEDSEEGAPCEDWMPHKNLVSLTDGRGGFLAPVTAEWLGK